MIRLSLDSSRHVGYLYHFTKSPETTNLILTNGIESRAPEPQHLPRSKKAEGYKDKDGNIHPGLIDEKGDGYSISFTRDPSVVINNLSSTARDTWRYGLIIDGDKLINSGYKVNSFIANLNTAPYGRTFKFSVKEKKVKGEYGSPVSIGTEDAKWLESFCEKVLDNPYQFNYVEVLGTFEDYGDYDITIVKKSKLKPIDNEGNHIEITETDSFDKAYKEAPSTYLDSIDDASNGEDAKRLYGILYRVATSGKNGGYEAEERLFVGTTKSPIDLKPCFVGYLVPDYHYLCNPRIKQEVNAIITKYNVPLYLYRSKDITEEQKAELKKELNRLGPSIKSMYRLPR